VVEARRRQAERFAGEKGLYANAQMPPKMIRKYAAISAESEKKGRCGYELLKRFAGVLGQRLRATRLQLLDVYGTRV
jgi:predicted ATPase with chaperone activity